MFNVMQMAEVVTQDGNGVLPHSFKRETHGNTVTVIMTEITEVENQSSHEDINSLCFLFLKSISVFFSGINKRFLGLGFGKEGLKHTISALCHYFRDHVWGF